MTRTEPAPPRSFARVVTDRLDPKAWIIVASIAIGWSSGDLAGIGWGLFGVLFAAIIPVLIIKSGTKRGAWADRHLGVRSQRITVMMMIILSLGVGIGSMLALGAPRVILATIAAMLSTLLVLLAITTRWKISVHSTVASGAVAMLGLTFGPIALVIAPMVVLVGWSRLELQAHSRAQVVAGAVLGAACASLTFLAIR